MKRTISRSSHAQGSNMRDGRARSPRTRSIRARSPHGRSTSRGRSPIHRSSIRQRSPNRRRLTGRNLPLSNRLSIVRPPSGGNALRGRNRGPMGGRRRNKRTKWRQNKKNRRRGRAVAARNAQGRQNDSTRLRMDDYRMPRARARRANKDVDIDRAVAKARREASTRTKDIFWTKRLLDAEQTMPSSSTTSRRWVHSGFKEMYKEELGYSEAEQSDRMQRNRRRSDSRIRREVRSLERRPSPHSKRKASRSPIRKGENKSRQKSKSPQLKARSSQKLGLLHSRQRSLSRSPSSSNSSISSSSFSGSYSSYSRSSSGSSLSGTSSVSSISYERRKKKSISPSPTRVSPSHEQVRNSPPLRRPQQKVVPKGTKLRDENTPAVDSHYRRSPDLQLLEPIEVASTKHYDRDEMNRRSHEVKHYVEKVTYSKPINSGGEETDSDSTSGEDGPRKMTLSERFGKLAQLSSQRQEYEGIRMKIVREGGQDKKVYLEGRTLKSRSPSPRKSRPKGAHEKWLREHKAEYDDYEKRYGEFRQWNPHRDLPSELPLNWDDVNVRYRYYKESGYFGDRNISMDDYLKWEEWWYRYRDWLEKYGGSRDRDSRNSSMSYGTTRISSSLWSRDKEDRKRRRY